MSPKRYYRHMTPELAAEIRRRYFTREAKQAWWRARGDCYGPHA